MHNGNHEAFWRTLTTYQEQVRVAVPMVFAAVAASCDSRTDAVFGLVVMIGVLASPQWRALRDYRLKARKQHSQQAQAEESSLDQQIGWHPLPSLLVLLWFVLKIAYLEQFK